MGPTTRAEAIALSLKYINDADSAVRTSWSGDRGAIKATVAAQISQTYALLAAVLPDPGVRR